MTILGRKSRCNMNANEGTYKTSSNLPGGLSFLNMLCDYGICPAIDMFISWP